MTLTAGLMPTRLKDGQPAGGSIILTVLNSRKIDSFKFQSQTSIILPSLVSMNFILHAFHIWVAASKTIHPISSDLLCRVPSCLDAHCIFPQELCAPATTCVSAIPLPPVAKILGRTRSEGDEPKRLQLDLYNHDVLVEDSNYSRAYRV